MRAAAIALLFVACSFTPGTLPGRDGAIEVEPDSPMLGIDPPWWDNGWGKRQRLVVTTGPNRPDKGYAGYTVRLASLAVGSMCDDVRVAVWTDPSWMVVPHHLLGCTDLRFALPTALGDNAAWREAFVYYDNASASPAASPVPGEVYRFWDAAEVDRATSYQRGRMDPWLATGHDNSLAYNAAGYYTYDTGDNSQSSYRIAVDERDVLVEAEWFHTGCYSFNMQSTVCVRGMIASGTGATETADHYYCTTRAQNPSCADDDQDIYDGDIIKTDNEIIAVQGIADPPAIVPSQWRRQALAAFGINPTQLRFWDADASWPALAMPPASALQATGSDNNDYEGRGFAGLMVAQDIARFRSVVVRRYVEPEPIVTVETVEVRPTP